MSDVWNFKSASRDEEKSGIINHCAGFLLEKVAAETKFSPTSMSFSAKMKIFIYCHYNVIDFLWVRIAQPSEMVQESSVYVRLVVTFESDREREIYFSIMVVLQSRSNVERSTKAVMHTEDWRRNQPSGGRQIHTGISVLEFQNSFINNRRLNPQETVSGLR